ncbi:hypothetical protein GGI25_002604 [Coemansia spiralis]|uniref:Pentatricopeptide repeat-containing protein n=2 Tax=Coemansia TaxID=4863 RepID=A0A9W8G8I6_9FUNG|nr:hypothetical protein EDC05_002906 [Coemansia umbellata]KAJ2623352.1 hypothetical protein GGI26_002390 [Coemansia sp. RSA 1358]KAJ2678100.1 hypothetical protein GGI25_002604 [Coemansia spiralis]
MESRQQRLTSNSAGHTTMLGNILAPKSRTGRTSKSFTTQLDFFGSKIQILSLATQYRQITTIRLPRSQGSLPVASLTAFTLWARTIQTLLTFSPQDRVVSAAPLLCLPYVGRRHASTDMSARLHEEFEVMRLAQCPTTIAQAIILYKRSLPKIPLHSRTPWMLLSCCYNFQATSKMEAQWLTRSIRAMYNGEGQSVQELLLRAYIRIGDLEQLRENLLELCMNPVPISPATLAAVLVDLQDTLSDRQLACRLWEGLLGLPDFAPSQTCVQLAMKLAMHSDNTELANKTYQMVLSGRWKGIKSGFWAEQIIIYGLAINGFAIEAAEVAMATTDSESLTNRVVAMQTIQKYELLLKGLSITQKVDEAEAVFTYIREDLELWPTQAMYSSLIGVVACHREWDTIEKYLEMVEEDGLVITETLWKRVLLGVSRQARVDMCDRVLDIMSSRGVPYSHVLVLSAIEAYSRLGNLEMVVRWYNVVYKALQAQAQLSYLGQRDINIDGTATHNGLRSSIVGSMYNTAVSKQMEDQALPYIKSLEQPEGFVAYFIQNNELVWHREVLVRILDALGDMGDDSLLIRAWEDILMFQRKVRTLKLSPYMYMVFARSLARLRILDKYEGLLIAWIDDPANCFSKRQREEIIQFVKICKTYHKSARLHPVILARQMLTKTIRSSDMLENDESPVDTGDAEAEAWS